jgi:hypothetical protein
MGKLGCGCTKVDLLCVESIFIASSVPNIIRNLEAYVHMTYLATVIELAWF